MKQHKIIMRPIGYRIPTPGDVIPEDAETIAYTTEAALIGTLSKYRDGTSTIHEGLLAQDKTFVVGEADARLVMNERLLSTLETGKVHKRLSVGTLEYDIKAKLIFICQPFEPSERVKAVFEISGWRMATGQSVTNTQ